MGKKLGTLLVSNPSTFVEKIYFNTALTKDEVNALFLNNESFTDNEVYEPFSAGDSSNYIQIIVYKEKGYVTINALVNGSIVGIFGSDGWRDTFSGVSSKYLEFNSYGVSEVNGTQIGTKNDLLQTLLSMNSDFKDTETDIETLLHYIGSAIRTVKGTTAKINAQDFVSEILALSTGESGGSIPGVSVNNEDTEIVVNLDETEFGGITINGSGQGILAHTSDAEITINGNSNAIYVNGSNYICLNDGSIDYTYGDELYIMGDDAPFNYCEISKLEEVSMCLTGNHCTFDIDGNDNIITLQCITNNKKVYIDTTSGDKNNIYIDNVPLSELLSGGSGGTPVPNTGYVENIYLNTNLSIDEVVSIIENANLTYDMDGFYDVFENGEDNTLFIMNGNGMYIILGRFNAVDTIYFSNMLIPDMGIDFTGWNTSFDNPLIFNLNNNSTNTENDKLSSLFSITPFE